MIAHINASQKDARCCPASRTREGCFDMNEKYTTITVAQESNFTARIPTAKDSLVKGSRDKNTLTSIFVECIRVVKVTSSHGVRGILRITSVV
jgi:hypothetical protein